MAKADVKMPDEFLASISRLGAQTDSIAEKILQAGGEVALAKVKSNLKSVVGSGTKSKSRSTGELERSLGLSPVMVDKNGNHDIKVGFSEPRTDGGSNAKIANIRHKQSVGETVSETCEIRCEKAVRGSHEIRI